MISRSEREDFDKELRQRGRSLDEFEVRSQTLTQGKAYRPDTVTVRHTQSGNTREYSAEMWVTDFLKDSDAHIF